MNLRDTPAYRSGLEVSPLQVAANVVTRDVRAEIDGINIDALLDDGDGEPREARAVEQVA